jgi:hypothetical protein
MLRENDMKKIAVALLFVSLSVNAEVSEMYMANEAGGYVVLTVQECAFEEQKKIYPNRAYATENDGEIIHEGCWNSPSIDDAPKHPSVKIIPVVNTWWETGDKAMFLTSNFGPEKKRISY